MQKDLVAQSGILLDLHVEHRVEAFRLRVGFQELLELRAALLWRPSSCVGSRLWPELLPRYCATQGAARRVAIES